DYLNSNSAIGLTGPLTVNNVPVPFEGLSDHDKNAVLRYLAYQPLYALEATNGVTYHVENGTTTTTNFVPNQVWNKISGSVTFARNAGGDTLTLNNGKHWDTDYGFAAGQYLHISNTAGNNTSGGTNLYKIASISGSTLKLTVGNSVIAETDNN